MPAGGKGCSGGQEKDQMVRLEGDATELGMEFEGLRSLYRRPADDSTGRGGDGGIHAEKARHGDLYSCKATWEGRGRATHDTYTRPGGRGEEGGRGGEGGGGGGEGRRRVLPKRLKSESGRHCLGVYMCALTVSS